ncbi:MAG TPA: response regulator, partial [Solirubrobacteraceae bacterium]
MTEGAMVIMPDGSGSAQRIVVVEDPESAALLQRILAAAGYEDVRVPAVPMEAETLLETADPDLVVLDLQLPGVDGFAMLERIVATGVPTLVLTADDTPTTRRRALG